MVDDRTLAAHREMQVLMQMLFALFAVLGTATGTVLELTYNISAASSGYFPSGTPGTIRDHQSPNLILIW